MLCTSAGSISHSPRTSYLSQDRLVRPSQCAIVCQGTGRAMDTSDSELQTLMSRESSVKCRGTVRPPKCTLVFRRKDLCCDLLRLNQIFCSFVLLESSVARSLILDMGSDILIFFQNKTFLSSSMLSQKWISQSSEWSNHWLTWWMLLVTGESDV